MHIHRWASLLVSICTVLRSQWKRSKAMARYACGQTSRKKPLIWVVMLAVAFMACESGAPSDSMKQTDALAASLVRMNPALDISGLGYSSITLTDSSKYIEAPDGSMLQIKGDIEIVGKVVSAADYSDSTNPDWLAKVGGDYDLGLCWGPNAADDNPSLCVSWDRASTFAFGKYYDTLKVAHIHLISFKPRLNLNGLKYHDWVKVRGKLVNVRMKGREPSYTSVNHTDWMCEMVLVESVEVKPRMQQQQS